MANIEKYTMIENTSLLSELKEDLMSNNIITIAHLLNYSVVELLSFDNISIWDILCIKEFLNANEYHLVGEELVDFYDSYNDERNSLLKRCQMLIDQRNKIRGKEKFQAEEYALCQQIYSIFEQVRVLRDEQKKSAEENVTKGK